MCSKMMNGGGWAQQLGWHACPRHTAHLCRRFPRCLRRLGAASCRSRWNLCVPPTMMLVGEDWRAGEEINSYGSGPVQGEGLMCMACRAEAVRSRTIHCRTACWRFSRQPKRVWFHRRFHSGNNRNSVPLRELPPQRGPRQFSVERSRMYTHKD